MSNLADLVNAESVRLGSTALAPLGTLGSGQLSIAEAMFKNRETAKRDAAKAEAELKKQREELTSREGIAKANDETRRKIAEDMDRRARDLALERDKATALREDARTALQDKKLEEQARLADKKERAGRVTATQKAYKEWGVPLRASDFDENGDLTSDAEDAANLTIAKAHKAEMDDASKLAEKADQIRSKGYAKALTETLLTDKSFLKGLPKEAVDSIRDGKDPLVIIGSLSSDKGKSWLAEKKAQLDNVKSFVVIPPQVEDAAKKAEISAMTYQKILETKRQSMPKAAVNLLPRLSAVNEDGETVAASPSFADKARTVFGGATTPAPEANPEIVFGAPPQAATSTSGGPISIGGSPLVVTPDAEPEAPNMFPASGGGTVGYFPPNQFSAAGAVEAPAKPEISFGTGGFGYPKSDPLVLLRKVQPDITDAEIAHLKEAVSGLPPERQAADLQKLATGDPQTVANLQFYIQQMRRTQDSQQVAPNPYE